MTKLNLGWFSCLLGVAVACSGNDPAPSPGGPGTSSSGGSNGGTKTSAPKTTGDEPSGGASTDSTDDATGGSSATKTRATTAANGGSSQASGSAKGGASASSHATTASNGGSSATGGSSGSNSARGGQSSTGTSTTLAGSLPRLKVNGNKLQDPSGNTVVLRGSSLIDIGALYKTGGNNVKGITERMDKLTAAGVQGKVVRFPVYPKIDYNGGYPYCSPVPYPVGTGPTTTCTATSPLSADDYVSKVLKPAVDYATSKDLYVIIDFHQIDDATKGTSAADATTFWSDIAPRFAEYPNVLYEPFNEPIDLSATWATLKPVVEGWISTIRESAPDTILIVPSNSYDQRPGDAAASPPSGTNLMYTAHIYPGNWNAAFQTQVSNAVAKVPVFITEWGYILNGSDKTLGTSKADYGKTFQTQVDGYGASWIAWVTDNSWTPNMFSDSAITKLTDFGELTKAWLAAD